MILFPGSHLVGGWAVVSDIRSFEACELVTLAQPTSPFSILLQLKNMTPYLLLTSATMTNHRLREGVTPLLGKLLVTRVVKIKVLGCSKVYFWVLRFSSFNKGSMFCA